MDHPLEQDERLLERFFGEQLFEVTDDGFSHRVMKKIPDRARRLNRLWTALCLVAAVAFIIAERGLTAMVGSLQGLWADVSTHELLSRLNPLTVYLALVLLAAVGSYRLLAAERRHVF